MALGGVKLRILTLLSVLAMGGGSFASPSLASDIGGLGVPGSGFDFMGGSGGGGSGGGFDLGGLFGGSGGGGGLGDIVGGIGDVIGGLPAGALGAIVGIGIGVGDQTSTVAACKDVGLNGTTLGKVFSLGNQTIGETICNAVYSFEGLPGFIAAMVYLFGIILTIWAIVELKDHIIDPKQVPLLSPLKKFLVGGMLFTLPYFTVLVGPAIWGSGAIFGYDDPMVAPSCGLIQGVVNILGGNMPQFGGLDCMLANLAADLWQPVQIGISVFCYLAGLVMLVAAIKRILRKMDEGPRSPVGMGTFGLFFIAGALLSIDAFIGLIGSTLFPSDAGDVRTTAILMYAPGLDATGWASVGSVLTSILTMMILVGMISIVRGLFILKDVADGNGNASLMASATHLFGGALAVNLGSVIRAVQDTFGLTVSGVGIYAF